MLTFPIFAAEVEGLKEECFLSRRLVECRKSLIFTYERTKILKDIFGHGIASPLT
jgi:hypothetical protein